MRAGDQLCPEKASRQTRADRPELRQAGPDQILRPGAALLAEPVPPFLSARPEHGRLLCGQTQEIIEQDPKRSGREGRPVGDNFL